jgi:hypothetical protein
MAPQNGRPDGVTGRRLPGAAPSHKPAAAPAPAAPASARPVAIDDGARTRSWRGVALVSAFLLLVAGSLGVAAVAAGIGIVIGNPELIGIDDPYASVTGAGGGGADTGMEALAEEEEQQARTGGGKAGGPAEPGVDPNAPGPVSVKMEGSHPFLEFEVICPSGFRNRADLRRTGSGTVQNVPKEQCSLAFNGGPPARVWVTGGSTRTCSWTGQIVCR